MPTVFEDFIKQHTTLNDEQIARISSLAVHHKLRRNEFLLNAGDTCRYKTFIISGLLRVYTVSADGAESILQFSPEKHWAIDAESYNEERPSKYCIDAVEPTELLMWTKHNFNSLLNEFPEMKQYSERVIASNIYINRNRLALALSATPEERYLEFEQNSPELMARLPLRMIAAYLGISLKTLTRIRHAQLVR